MSNPSHRPNREARKAKKQLKKSKKNHRHSQTEREAHSKKLEEARETPRHQQEKEGVYQPQISVPDKQSEHKTIEKEREEREQAVAAQTQLYRRLLPIWLRQLARLKDPRQAIKIKHKLTAFFISQLTL